MTSEKAHVLFFEEIDMKDTSLVGGKNASLGEMVKAGIPVPPGFAVTTSAYKTFLRENNLEKKILDLLAPLKKGDVEKIQHAGKEIRGWIETAHLPDEIYSDIEKSYNKLCEDVGTRDLSVAVRSSATAEDLPGASFAGQQDTYLFVRGVKDVVDKVTKCWASLFTPRVISYRIEMGFPHEAVFISVGVQKMVNAYVAGVMMTLNPLTGDPSTIVINSNFGVGESVVSGEVTPDEFLVNKITFEILQKKIGSKEVYYVSDEDMKGVIKKEQSPEKRKVQSISDEEIKELVKIGKVIEKHYGTAMDIEWAAEKGGEQGKLIFYIVQARPETVWSTKKDGQHAKKQKREIDVMGMIVERLKKGQKLKS